MREIEKNREQLLLEIQELHRTIAELQAAEDGRKQQEEADLRQSFFRLQKTLESTVNVVEKRDPYISGHQQRVTRLACALARELKLPEDRIEGLWVAGSLHDIGKIYVRADILNKSSFLSDIEMAIIKIHPQIGYEIINAVNLPWPVAPIIRQHHERMDGSGYPAGLPGEDILLEARILAVADVVDAMSSERPYRNRFNINSVLLELSKGSGTLFDPDVIECCLRLFSEKGYKLIIK
jgi:putative nucleotidyltransferase with HDIG domain